MIFAVFIRRPWAYGVSIGLVAVIIVYELLSFDYKHSSFKRIMKLLSEGDMPTFVNMLDFLLLASVLLDDVLGLGGVDINTVLIIFDHFAVFLLYVRLIFCLRIFAIIRLFLQVFVDVTIGIIPFSLILMLLFSFSALNGFLIPNPDNQTYEGEFVEALDGIFFGNVELGYLTDQLTGLQFFTKWFIIFTRQLLLSLFFPNGILIGIVANIYNKGEEHRELIALQSLTNSLQEINLFYLNLSKLLCGRKIARPAFLHRIVTNLHFEKDTAEGKLDRVLAELLMIKRKFGIAEQDMEY